MLMLFGIPRLRWLPKSDLTELSEMFRSKVLGGCLRMPLFDFSAAISI
jgi:hypothetical protein